MGTWESIRELEADYDLMFDGVFNHCSSRSQMFQEFLQGDPRLKESFIAYDSPDDLTPDQRSKIFRPRTSDILTRFDTINGPKWVWTTFSNDQIDFNFRNPEVLLSVVGRRISKAHPLGTASGQSGVPDRLFRQVARHPKQEARSLRLAGV